MPHLPRMRRARGIRTAQRPSIWILPHRPQSAGAARRIVEAALRCRGTDRDTVDRALLVVSELVTNAIEHAQPPIVLRVHHPAVATVRIEVHDGGPATREGAWTTSCRPEERGRGNDIVDLTATRHGSHAHPFGTTYWAELSAP
ncbi:ATP-binding protein [Kitasatospora cinereorecta]